MTDTIYTDDDGMLFKYVVSYSHKGRAYGFTIWAESMAGAENRLHSISESGLVNGRMLAELPLQQGGHPDE